MLECLNNMKYMRIHEDIIFGFINKMMCPKLICKLIRRTVI